VISRVRPQNFESNKMRLKNLSAGGGQTPFIHTPLQSSGSELSNSVRNSNLAARWISAGFAFLRSNLINRVIHAGQNSF